MEGRSLLYLPSFEGPYHLVHRVVSPVRTGSRRLALSCQRGLRVSRFALHRHRIDHDQLQEFKANKVVHSRSTAFRA